MSGEIKEEVGLCKLVDVPVALLFFETVYAYYDICSPNVQAIMRAHGSDSLRFLLPRSEQLPIKTFSIPTDKYFKYVNGEAVGLVKTNDRAVALANQLASLIRRRARARGEKLILVSREKMSLEPLNRGNDVLGYSATLENLALVDGYKLRWDQVKEIRSDKESRQKLLRLRNWLRGSFKAESDQEAKEKIELCIYDYSDAVRKHGLETRIGLLNSLVDFKTISAVLGLSTVGQLLDIQVISTLLTGVGLVGRSVARVAETKLSGQFVTPMAELAPVEYITELQKKFAEEDYIKCEDPEMYTRNLLLRAS